MKNNEITDKFLAQSYLDAWSDYEYSLESNHAESWDWVILTASNQKQAEAYYTQIEKRIREERLPVGTKFEVIADPNGERVGSGGATLNALNYLLSKEGNIEDVCTKKVAIIHSGGDGKRIPQYSACGKLFSPIPRILPNGKRSTIFDELIISISGIPARIGSGVLVMPGDTVILFNPLQLDLKAVDAAALSIKVGVSEGKEHGVFLGNQDGFVSHFLHKQSEEKLRLMGAVNNENNVDIDTGVIWLGPQIERALLELICTDGGHVDEKKKNLYISESTCLSFYSEFVYPLSADATKEQYMKEIPEKDFSDNLMICRDEIWENLKSYQMKLIRMTPARYIHIGTTSELLQLTTKDIHRYKYMNWNKNIFTNYYKKNGNNASNNCLLSSDALIEGSCYFEDCIIGENVVIGKNSIISGIEVSDIVIPSNTVLHCFRLLDGNYICRIYGIEDNPKSSADGAFLGSTLRKIMKIYNIAKEDIWNGKEQTIWNAKLYPVCKSMGEALNSALFLWRMCNQCQKREDIDRWRCAERLSLNESFNLADISEILKWQEYIEDRVCVENCIKCLVNGSEMKLALSCLTMGEHMETQANMLWEAGKKALWSLKIRIMLLFSMLCKKYNRILLGRTDKQFEDLCYQIICDNITESVMRKHSFIKDKVSISEREIIVELPVRVNFCGSPSDAAPYCLEHGGTMLDGALLLKEKKPIRVAARFIPEKEIVFESYDLKSKKIYTEIKNLQNCSNPHDTFALHKAVLLACGIIPLGSTEYTLEKILDGLGGGIYLSTEADVPKGSGLGTSSIVAAACVKGINGLLNQDVSDKCIYAQVFAVEQLMSTGGGWQDQVGGLTPGIKLIRSKPGIYQDISVDKVKLTREAMQELQDRFVLIFSGQRRLARNVLREEMNQCIRNDSGAMNAMNRIQQLCVLMKFELERGNITAFAGYITEQFNLVKQLDKGASNTCIEYIFDVCDDLIDGKAICGAGGGGFLQIILKEGVTKAQLKKRITSIFQDCGVEVWDSSFI